MIPPVHYTPAIVAPVHKQQNQVSFQGALQTLEPQKVWEVFEEISRIYRESGHCKEISTYLEERLKKAGFDVLKKVDGTICAARGVNREHNNAIILQSHMDIVGVSADGNPKKPIEFRLKDGWLYANDRTLGADDGLGVAAMVAIAEDAKFKKFPLEMIFTTDEEVGLKGAKKLTAGDFYGKYLINLDSEDYGHIIKGCAGTMRYEINEGINTIALAGASGFKKISMAINGSRGGHSATIQPESINPILTIINEIKGIQGLKLVSIEGGERENAIPRNAKAEFLIPQDMAPEVVADLKAKLAKLKQEKGANNPALDYDVIPEDAQEGIKYLDPEFQSKVFDALSSLPTGLRSQFEDGVTSKTSQNLGVIKIADGKFYAKIMGRSADEKEGKQLRDETSSVLSSLFGKPISTTDQSPIWQPRNNSLLQDAAVSAYSKISNGEMPGIKVEHGGLETATFIEKRPDLDMISIGPTIEDPHSVQERVKVDTVAPFYNWLANILEELAKRQK